MIGTANRICWAIPRGCGPLLYKFRIEACSAYVKAKEVIERRETVSPEDVRRALAEVAGIADYSGL